MVHESGREKVSAVVAALTVCAFSQRVCSPSWHSSRPLDTTIKRYSVPCARCAWIRADSLSVVPRVDDVCPNWGRMCIYRDENQDFGTRCEQSKRSQQCDVTRSIKATLFVCFYSPPPLTHLLCVLTLTGSFSFMKNCQCLSPFISPDVKVGSIASCQSGTATDKYQLSVNSCRKPREAIDLLKGLSQRLDAGC